jgi:hypothetical protein
MLRTLGSSLVAKASPGARLRETTEQQIQKPEFPNKGQVGTLSRASVEEPLTREVPPGSEKIVSIQPTIEGTQVAPVNVAPLPTAPVSPVIPGVSLPSSVTASVPSGAQNQALFKGGVSTPTGKAPMGGIASTVSKPAVAAPAVTSKAATTTPVSVKAPIAPTTVSGFLGGILPSVMSLGGKIYAEGEGTNIPRNLSQAIAGKVASVIPSGNLPVVGNLQSALQNYSVSPQIAKSGQGSLGGAIKTVAKSGGLPGLISNALRSQASNLFGGLRSLLKR